MKSVTKEIYLDDCRHCPVCNGTHINTRRPLVRGDAEQIFHTVNCSVPNCDTTWTDVFTLSDIIDLTCDGKTIEMV